MKDVTLHARAFVNGEEIECVVLAAKRADGGSIVIDGGEGNKIELVMSAGVWLVLQQEFSYLLYGGTGRLS
ncbi:MAG TPA: hypothetical protein VGG48_19135 [Rhizomicrobium sp.]|jgi:hypothetical protein